MLSITPTVTGMTTTLKVEGRIVGEWVVELRSACDTALPRPQRPSLDLSGVTFVDAASLGELRNVVDRRAELVGCSLCPSALLRQRL